MVLDAYGVYLGQSIQNELCISLNIMSWMEEPSFLRYLQSKLPLLILEWPLHRWIPGLARRSILDPAHPIPTQAVEPAGLCGGLS